jgi:hypothetical protein
VPFTSGILKLNLLQVLFRESFSSSEGMNSYFSDVPNTGVVEKYVPSGGALSEQFDKDNATPVSASDLTWSHAVFHTAANRQLGIKSPSWVHRLPVRIGAFHAPATST